MLILVDAGTHDYVNLGDVAMLRVAVRRLRATFPQATIRVFTTAPERLRELCPDAEPVAYWPRPLWFGGDLLGPAQRRLPDVVGSGLARVKDAVRRRYPKLLNAWLRLRVSRARPRGLAEWDEFVSVLQETRLVFIAGAGGFTDHGPGWTNAILDLIEHGAGRGIPVFMVGQGFGPLTDPIVRQRCRKLLPRVTRIFLREGPKSGKLLEEIGVASDRVAFTGDDAVETAFTLRPSAAGAALGVNVRIARSAGTDRALLDVVRSVVRQLREILRCDAVAAPIEIHTDTAAIAEVLEHPAPAPGDEIDVVRAIGRCRVLISGAYHAAVFALSQGVPVVGIIRAPYFRDKFHGLADQFPGGCLVLDATDPEFAVRLRESVERLWASAPGVRETLLAVAKRQVEMGRSAYDGLARLATEARG